jgi:hypothetical protein
MKKKISESNINLKKIDANKKSVEDSFKILKFNDLCNQNFILSDKLYIDNKICFISTKINITEIEIIDEKKIKLVYDDKELNDNFSKYNFNVKNIFAEIKNDIINLNIYTKKKKIFNLKINEFRKIINECDCIYLLSFVNEPIDITPYMYNYEEEILSHDLNSVKNFKQYSKYKELNCVLKTIIFKNKIKSIKCNKTVEESNENIIKTVLKSKKDNENEDDIFEL